MYLSILEIMNGLQVNFGTYTSIIQTLANSGKSKAIRRILYSEVFTKQAPESKFKINRKY